MNKIEEAALAFEQAMLGGRKNMMDQMGRSGKGELFILKFLSDKKTAVIPSELSDAMHTSTARISAALNSLEKKGQIHREIDPHNRRNILVTITPAGRERSHNDMLQMRKLMVGILTEMGEDDALEFIRLLTRFGQIAARAFESSAEAGTVNSG